MHAAIIASLPPAPPPPPPIGAMVVTLGPVYHAQIWPPAPRDPEIDEDDDLLTLL